MDPLIEEAMSRTLGGVARDLRRRVSACAPGEPELAQRGEVDALVEDLVVAGGDFVHEGQLQGGEGEERFLFAAILFGDGGGCIGDGLMGAGVLELHECCERGRVFAVLQIGGGDAEALEFVDGEVDITGARVEACIGHASSERDGVAECAGEGWCLRVIETVDVSDEFGGCTAGGVAVVREAGEVEVAHLGEVHFGTVEDSVEGGASECGVFDDGGEGAGDGVSGGAGEEAREFLAPPIELGVGDAGVTDGGVNVGDFLTEGVGGVSGVAFGRWELEERVVECGAGGGGFLAAVFVGLRGGCGGAGAVVGGLLGLHTKGVSVWSGARTLGGARTRGKCHELERILALRVG